MTDLLEITGLTVRFRLRDAVVQAVTNLDLTVRRGELLAVVGESGCGKSVLAHALLGLLPANAGVTGRALITLPPAAGVARTSTDRTFVLPGGGERPGDRTVVLPGGGERPGDRTVVLPGGGERPGDRTFVLPGGGERPGDRTVDLLGCGETTLARQIRGRRIGLIPQSPATALTVVRKGRRLLAETLKQHGRDPRLADQVAAEAGLDPADLERYPFELSGGMAQRLCTALALASDPELLIADEPTSGLDRPLVDHTLDLLRRRCDEGAAVLLITHDLAAAERVADTVAVMYASRIVEHRPAADLFRAPAHPYSQGLLNALPDRDFRAIPGHPPMLTALPPGCAFAARCTRVTDACKVQPAGPVACHHPLTTAEVPA
ncbi:peptide/nickel transport system ATP-binding protein [Actinoplanes italicus]|uniref:Nickel import system ATP-binding protein NikD n=1 Tax=Actinoplanes italicus TaxID=113567 RepID=A0A2T0JWH8_9ACTN|nr:ABC transporter ATP-binding protein [Actinoplanes italicus]PRX12035.1 peptide/nickel transport system ATP-binding protein [Actinoplanes italicus]